MAILHAATLSPSKLELITAHLKSVKWLSAPPVDVRLVAAYRFDDPEGEVGIETHLISVGSGPTVQVPLTYRNAPLASAENWLLGTMEHSVLGTRWVYDGCGDPAYAAALVQTIVGGGTEAELMVQTDSGTKRRDPTATVRGTGTSPDSVAVPESASTTSTGSDAILTVGRYQVVVRHLLGEFADTYSLALLGNWIDSELGTEYADVPLAYLA